MASTALSLMPPARTPNLRVTAAFVLAVVTAVGGTVWFFQNREFMAIHDVMERNQAEFERVDPDEVANAVSFGLGEAEHRALGTYSATRFPHSRPYLGRFSAPQLGRGFEDELVYAIRLKGWSPGPIIQNNGDPQEFVAIIPARVRGTDGRWLIALPTEPPYLTPETMR